MKMDVSKFKKLSSDDKQTVLKHPRGHQIIIAHNALSPDLKKQVKQLPDSEEEGYAEGGEVEDRKPASFIDTINNLVNSSNAAANDAGAHAIEAQQSRENPGSVFGGAMMEEDAPAEAPQLAPEMAAPSLAPAPPMMGMAPQPQAAMPAGYGKGVGEMKAGIQQEAAAQAELGKQQNAAEVEHQKFLQQAHQDYQSNFQKLNQEYQAVMHDYQNQHINPNHYMENMSSGKKVATAIGLIMSGIGSGLAGQENMAQKYLNDQIQRDVEAQKANLGKTENLLSANLKQFGNMQQATEMTMAMQNGIYASKLRQAAALAMDPMAKARALQQAGQLDAQSAMMMQKVAAAQTQQGILQNPNASPVMKIQALPKDIHDDAMREYASYTALKEGMPQVDKIFGEAFKNSTLANQVMNPKQSEKLGKATLARLFPLAKAVADEKMTDSDVENMVKPFLPDVWTNEKTNQKLAKDFKQMIATKAKQKTGILREFNIVPELTSLNDQEQRLTNWAKANPNDPRSKKILQRIGE